MDFRLLLGIREFYSAGSVRKTLYSLNSEVLSFLPFYPSKYPFTFPAMVIIIMTY